MKKTILVVVSCVLMGAFIGVVAHAGPNSMVVLKRNNDDTASQQLLVGPPSSPGFLTFDPSNPTFTTLDSTLTLSSGVLSVSTPPVNADWNAVSGLAVILNKPTIPTIPSRSFSYTTRTLNSCFQVSASRDTFVTYAVDVSTTLSLSGGQTGTVYLRTYTNSSCTTGAQELARFVNGNTGTLTIGLNITQNATGTLTGIAPAGTWLRLDTENTAGAPTFTARPGQEVLL